MFSKSTVPQGLRLSPLNAAAALRSLDGHVTPREVADATIAKRRAKAKAARKARRITRRSGK